MGKAMNLHDKDRFLELWEKYFPSAELPITLQYAKHSMNAEGNQPPSGHQCFIGVLSKVRKGRNVYFDVDSVGCFGGRRYLGFSTQLSSNFSYFLSYGIPGELEGERYKKSPELVEEVVQHWPDFQAPAQNAVFKRWDNLDETDDPQVVIFFAEPNVLSGLFTLANFDESEPNGVYSPFCAGCASIVMYPYQEKDQSRPRGVLGMFDVSARPFVPDNKLTFAVPLNKFMSMVNNMEESFLITHSWEKVKKRIKS